jgi:hypothetical protein
MEGDYKRAKLDSKESLIGQWKEAEAEDVDGWQYFDPANVD